MHGEDNCEMSEQEKKKREELWGKSDTSHVVSFA